MFAIGEAQTGSLHAQSMNAVVKIKGKEEEGGMVNMAMGCSNDGWKTPDAAWFDTEVAEEGEVFIVSVALAQELLEDPGEMEHVECVSMEEKKPELPPFCLGCAPSLCTYRCERTWL
jgi:hypothetical protein